MRCLFLTLLLFCHSIIKAQDTERSWIKMFKGTIGYYPITMYLHKFGAAYEGYYYYDSQQKPIQLRGIKDYESDKIYLDCNIDDLNLKEALQFLINGPYISGKWNQYAKDTSIDLYAGEVKMPLSFKYVYVKGFRRLRPKNINSPEAAYISTTLWTKDNSETAILLKKWICNKLALNNNNHEEIESLLAKDKLNFLSDYLITNKSISDSTLKLSRETYSNGLSKKIMMIFCTSEIITLNYTSCSMAGGDIKKCTTEYASFNLSSIKELKIEDIFTSNGLKKLPGLIEKTFRKQFHLNASQSLTNAGFPFTKMEPSKNFFVTGKQIGFYYQETDKDSEDAFTVYLPFSELKQDIQPNFLKLIQ